MKLDGICKGVEEEVEKHCLLFICDIYSNTVNFMTHG